MGRGLASTCALAVLVLAGCSFLATDDNDRAFGTVGDGHFGIEILEAAPSETRGAISREAAIRVAASEIGLPAEEVTSATLGRISTTQRGGDLAAGPIAWAIVWERVDRVDVAIVEAHDSTVLSVSSGTDPN